MTDAGGVNLGQDHQGATRPPRTDATELRFRYTFWDRQTRDAPCGALRYYLSLYYSQKTKG